MDPLRPDEQLRQTPRFWEKVEVTKQYLKYIYIYMCNASLQRAKVTFRYSIKDYLS